MWQLLWHSAQHDDEPRDQTADSLIKPYGWWSLGPSGDQWNAERIRQDTGEPDFELGDFPSEAEAKTAAQTSERLEYLRQQIQAECISYGEIAELQGMAKVIDPGDVELLQWAGVPEIPDETPASTYIVSWSYDTSTEDSTPQEAAELAATVFLAGDPVAGPGRVEMSVMRCIPGMEDESLGEFTVTVPTQGDHLAEKCRDCHLFVEPNEQGPEFAEYVHLHRGDEADEALDETHEARPSGMKATLTTWKAFGPLAMRQRFTDYKPEES